MKKTMLIMAVLAIFGFTRSGKSQFHSGNTLTQEERSFAVKYMEETRDGLIKDLEGLSQNQLQFRTAPDRWSIADCVEHIAISESFLFQAVQMSLKKEAEPGKRDSIKVSDEQLIKALTDRSHKAQAPEMLKPTGRFKSTGDALAAFLEQRNKNIEYVKTTNDDLRNHFFSHPLLGTIDDYQLLLLITAHSRRHTLQLEEVKADAGFPKN
jgi:DinB superfamily